MLHAFLDCLKNGDRLKSNMMADLCTHRSELECIQYLHNLKGMRLVLGFYAVVIRNVTH